jgi:hypothetical protein
MTGDEHIEKFVSGEDGLVPSSGFTSSVMDAVRREASSPPPIAFPWMRALPGFALCATAVVVLMTSVIIRLNRGIPRFETAPAANVHEGAAVAWIFAACLVPAISVALAMRVFSRTN